MGSAAETKPTGIDTPSGIDRLPRIDGARCVHVAAVVASCRACADACPRGAWVIDGGGVGLEPDACDGCGLCASACPQGVIGHAHNVAKRREGRELVAFAACANTGLRNGRDGVEGVVPCLASIGLVELLALYGDGVRRLYVTREGCAGCATGSNTPMRLEKTVADLNTLLKGRGLDPLRLISRSSAPWRALLTFDTEPDGGPMMGRRALFRMSARHVSQMAENAGFPSSPAHAHQPPGRALPAPLPGIAAERMPWPWVPSIDAAVCDGCAACARICPSGAIRLDETSAGFRLSPPDCTGCRLCEDVCHADAILLERLSPQRQTLVPLEKVRCRACGVTEWVPARSVAKTTATADGLCRVCRKTGRTRTLFQVLD